MLAATAALGQTGQMMNDGGWGMGWMGGYGGIWVPILLVVVVPRPWQLSCNESASEQG